MVEISKMEIKMKRTLSVILGLALASASMVATADVSYAKSARTICKAYAKRQANHYANHSVGTGLVAGAASGAFLGGLLNGKKGVVPGLAFGAVGGTMLGAINGAEKKKRIYRLAYEDCMDNY